MSINPDIRQEVVNRLYVESLHVLMEVGDPDTDQLLARFQNTIARAEESDNTARSMAASIVMGAYGEELETQQFNGERLLVRIQDAIQKVVS